MKRNSRRPIVRRLLVLLGLALLAPAAVAAKKGGEPSVVIRVEGMGFLRDRELRAALERLLDASARPTLDANAMEDAAVILMSSLGEEGFQKPVIEIEATLADGAVERLVFDPTFAKPLPRSFAARAVKFNVKRGVRYHVEDVRFTGLTVIPEKQARGYFRSSATLVATAQTNAYSPGRVSRAGEALLDELNKRGYAEAEVRARPTADEATGKVSVAVEVREGARWQVASVRFQRDAGEATKLPAIEGWVGRPWSSTLQEDIREEIRQAYYRDGFPDVGVHVAAEPGAGAGGGKEANLIATIVPGPQVKVGEVRFVGNDRTRLGVLRRRVSLAPGEPLNVVEMERTRYRISRLGVFESVELRYEPDDGAVRNPVFALREGPGYETSLLMGYGSYEQLRVGVEHRQMNILGFAHQSRIELIQSMKSSSGEYMYTVPELFGESLDGTARLFGLQRREIAFLRQEFGVDLSLKRAVKAIHGAAIVSYTYQALRNPRNSLATQATDERQSNVASVTLGVNGDRRDNPLRPRHGYHWSAQIESADPRLGGQVTYQRFEFASGYHTGWGEGRWVHVGLAHGVVTTFGASGDKALPVLKRFYPGGDNSIRGYQRGEAAPRGADGRFIGAKTYLLGNLELEQALTPNWSLVVFGDALGMSPSLRGYPVDERLYSAGLGVRYQTLIGPLRLEYGRNLNPRPADPPGTWQFSIGYPF